MSNGIAVGDVVQLKSGGPKMTVVSIGDDYGQMQAWCEWFDSKQEPKTGGFALTSLMQV